MVSRCFVRRTTKAAHISTPHLKTFRVRFLGKYRLKQSRFKLVVIRFMFPSQRCHHNCYLWCSSCELRTKQCGGKCPRWQLSASIFLGVELFTFTSQARPQFRFCFWHFAQPRKRGQIEPSEVFSSDAINSVDRCDRQNVSALVLFISKRGHTLR